MLYVSSIKNNLYGITDAEDYTEEFYSYDDVIRFKKAGLHIWGIFGNEIKPTSVDAVLNFMRFRYKDFKINLVDGLITLIKYIGDKERVVIPRGIEVLGDGDLACIDNKDVRIVDIADTVVELSSNCFDSCSFLTEVKIPDGVKSIGSFCFYNCIGLSSVKFPSTVIKLYDGCFWGCTSLEFVDLSDGLKILPIECFHGCTALSSIILPKSLKQIGANCFGSCISLSRLDIVSNENSLTVGDNVFNHCGFLSDVRFTCKKLVMDLNKIGVFSIVPNLRYISINSGCDVSDVKLDKTNSIKLLWI